MDKELPISPWPEWKIVSKIGEGSFGRVYKAQRTEKGRSFYSAIKIITIPASKGELDSVRSESGDEKSVRGYFENLVEECIQEVSTMEYFRGKFPYCICRRLQGDGISGRDRMGYFYPHGISHKLHGILCGKKSHRKRSNEDWVSIFADHWNTVGSFTSSTGISNLRIFFVSRFGGFQAGGLWNRQRTGKNHEYPSKKGTYSYMAPEMYRGEQYDSRVDIYALGLVLYKLMNHNRLPFLNLEKQLDHIQR